MIMSTFKIPFYPATKYSAATVFRLSLKLSLIMLIMASYSQSGTAKQPTKNVQINQSNDEQMQTESDIADTEQSDEQAGASVEPSEKHKHHKREKKSPGEVSNDSDNHAAPCLSWIDPLVKPKVCLLCIHGLGLYSGAYTNFGLRMSHNGVATYAIDVRGFGSWMKAQGKEEVDFKACLEDIKVALQSIHAANPGLPVFLLGESMGGAIALRATAMYPDLVDGLISSVPAGDRFKQKKTDLKVALEFLTGPNRQHDVGEQIVKQATKNDQLRKDWIGDPLDRMDLSPKELLQFQKFMNENHDVAKQITKTPVLMVQGNKDKLVKPEGTWELFNEQATEKKTFLAVPCEHLIFEDQQDNNRVFDEGMAKLLTTWIFAHTANGIGQDIASSESNDLTDAIDKLIVGHFDDARTELSSIVAANPKDVKAHYWLGVANMKLHRPQDARKQFVSAISLGKGSSAAKNANAKLLMMETEKQAQSQVGNQTPTKPEVRQAINALLPERKPTILAFYAPWCEECDGLDAMFAQAKTFANNVKFLKVDINDHQNDQLVKLLSIGPIPTFVYLTADGRVASTLIGRTNFVEFAKNLGNIAH